MKKICQKFARLKNDCLKSRSVLSPLGGALFLLLGVGVAEAEEMLLPDLEILGRGATLLFSGPPTQKAVALTFDDGPNPAVTPHLLDILKQRNVPATFFVLGEKVQHHPEIVRRMVEEGHEVGNHTYSHANLNDLKPRGVSSELRKTQKAISAACGVRPTLVRPPYGATNLTTMATLANMGLSAVYWSIDTKDWKGRSAQTIGNEVFDNLANGSIILFHDHGPNTAEALPTIVNGIRRRGYSFRSVSDLFSFESKGMLAAGAPPPPMQPAPTATPVAKTVFAPVSASEPEPVPSVVRLTDLSEPAPPVSAPNSRRASLPKPPGLTIVESSPMPTSMILRTSPSEQRVIVPKKLPTPFPTPFPVATSAPSPLPLPTDTPTALPTLPPATATPIPVTIPTATAIDTLAPPQATNTPVPSVLPANTKTPTAADPTATSAPIPHTETHTPVPPTSTRTATSTAPPTLTHTSTPTHTLVPTHTPSWTPSSTPTPERVFVTGGGAPNSARQFRRLVPIRDFTRVIETEELPSPYDPLPQKTPPQSIGTGRGKAPVLLPHPP